MCPAGLCWSTSPENTLKKDRWTERQIETAFHVETDFVWEAGKQWHMHSVSGKELWVLSSDPNGFHMKQNSTSFVKGMAVWIVKDLCCSDTYQQSKLLQLLFLMHCPLQFCHPLLQTAWSNLFRWAFRGEEVGATHCGYTSEVSQVHMESADHTGILPCTQLIKLPSTHPNL